MQKYPLFQVYGVELEYMIVNQDTLDVMPIADQLFQSLEGAPVAEIERGEMSWSNELALHVMELKVTDPVSTLEGLQEKFQAEVQKVNELLKPFQAKLLPTGMHPWMDPLKDFYLWPHEGHEIYETYHRIFDCRSHGWMNLQSMHLNLPFVDDKEFALLHAAIRVLLPILPALAASSPISDGAKAAFLDNRMQVYKNNALSIPSIAGKIVPEAVFSQQEYEEKILQPIYRDLAEKDPDHIITHEWCNSRGAIARFDRFTIEIRVLDVQECPLADLAIASATVAVLKALVAQKWTDSQKLREFPLEELDTIFRACTEKGESAEINNASYLELFGFQKESCQASELWSWILAQTAPFKGKETQPLAHALQLILEQGPLGRRILRAWQHDPTPTALRKIYRRLSDCLEQGELFSARR